MTNLIMKFNNEVNKETIMARTTIELTTKELQEYHPGGKQKDEQIAERWDRAWKIANTAAAFRTHCSN